MLCSTIGSLNIVAVIAISIIGFLLGGLWYSVLFGKAWLAEMKMTEETMKAAGGGGRKMIVTLLLTFVTVLTLATLESALGLRGVGHGAKLGACVGVGFVLTRVLTSAQYEGKSLKLVAIVGGYDLALLVVAGAILGVWR